MTPVQGALIAAGFIAAVFVLTLGAGTAYEWWKACKAKRAAETESVRIALKKVVDDFMDERAARDVDVPAAPSNKPVTEERK